MIKLILPLVLIFGIIGGVYLVENRVNLFPKADTQPFQQKFIISNLAPTSFAISYFTKTPTYDFIQYGTDTSVSSVVYDSRMKDGLNPQLNTHYFHLKDLKPNTLYYIKINSGGALLPADSYLTQQTPKGIRGRSGNEMFKGTVKKINNKQVPREAIVFLSTDQGQLLSAPMKENGDWSIIYRGMRKADMSAFYSLTGADQIKFMAYAGMDGFGLFGEYSLNSSGIDIEVDEGRIPFYKINLGQSNNPAADKEDKGSDNTIWVIISDFLNGK